MKKFALTASAFAVAAVLITPKFISTKVESQLEQAVEQINSAYGYKAEIANRQSNWFNTQATIKISVNTEELGIDTDNQDAEEFFVNFEVNAEHGLIMPSAKNKVGLVDMSVTMVAENLREHLDWPADKPLYQTQVNTSLTGATLFNDAITPFSMTDVENGIELNYQGYTGSGSFIDGEIAYIGNSKPLHVIADDSDITVSGIAVDMTAQASLAEIFQGNMYDSATNFKIESIVAKAHSGAEKATIKNILIDAITKVQPENGTASIEIGYGIDSIDAEDESVKDLALNIQVNNISNEFIEAYQQNQQVFTQGSDEEIQANIMKFAQNNLLALLKANPEINITKLQATFDDGSIVSHMNSSIQGIEQLPNIAENPMFWLNHVIANGELKGDESVIERFAVNQVVSQIKANPNAANMTEEEIMNIAQQQVPHLLQNFIQQGLIVKTDTGYQTKFDMVNSALKVNDVQIPLPF